MICGVGERGDSKTLNLSRACLGVLKKGWICLGVWIAEVGSCLGVLKGEIVLKPLNHGDLLCSFFRFFLAGVSSG